MTRPRTRRDVFVEALAKTTGRSVGQERARIAELEQMGFAPLANLDGVLDAAEEARLRELLRGAQSAAREMFSQPGPDRPEAPRRVQPG